LVALLADKKHAAVIHNAVDFLTSKERTISLNREFDALKNLGLEPTEVDLRKYFGKTEELKKILSSFDLIWVRGGNAFVLRRAFRQSGADKIIEDLLANDSIVYGGYSAGIDMLTSSLKGVELVDDPNIIPEGYDRSIIWDCLGILPYSVAPHYKSDHPESADIDKSVEYLIDNHILFMALRDGEVIIMNNEIE
jgi:dipeptidase E